MRSDASWNIDVITDRFLAKVCAEPNERGCWIWTGARNRPKNRHGYEFGYMTVMGFNKKASVVSWRIAHGRWPDDGECVLHTCDDPLCVNPDHLYLGTRSDNMRDCLKRGRSPKAKLTPDQVREIKVRLRIGESCTDIAEDYSVGRTTIAWIKSGQTWQHIE